MASPASRRFETSLSGSWSRNTSIPFSAAHETNRRRCRRDRREPTRNRPRSASAEGRLRPRIDCPDALPRAFDSAADGSVEHPAARDLEVREPRMVEDLRDPEDLPGRQLPREWLLREQADRGVDDFGIRCGSFAALGVRRRRPAPSGARDVAGFARVDLDPVARLTNSATWTTAPVSRVAGLSRSTVSLFTPGSVSDLSSTTTASGSRWACRRRRGPGPSDEGRM